MANHPNRDCKYAFISPRGFANEFVVWRVRPADVATVQALLDTYTDDTSAVAKWLDGPDARKRQAIDWEDRRFTGYAGSSWGYFDGLLD